MSTKVAPTYKLPRPNEFGDYWLGDKFHDPAIFPSSRLVERRDSDQKDVVKNGTFIATLGDVRGFVFDGPDLRRFKSPQEALVEINKRSG
jgi:hypothetical protein